VLIADASERRDQEHWLSPVGTPALTPSMAPSGATLGTTVALSSVRLLIDLEMIVGMPPDGIRPGNENPLAYPCGQD